MGTYIARADLEHFGVDNVAKWADLDGDADATKILARINGAIADGEAIVDAALRGGGYTVPVSGGGAFITWIAQRLAVYSLYTARGIDDDNKITGKMEAHYKEALHDLSLIQAGIRKLDAGKSHAGPTAPMVVM